jgi:Ala-tRNA(Pro) deacylase
MADPIDLVSAYLDDNAVEYEVVEHVERFTAASEARAVGANPSDATKEVLLVGDRGYVLAVIPASERLDLHKVQAVLEAEDRPRLATEDEIAEDFPAFEVGSVPPLGPDHAVTELFDGRLLDHDRVLCTGGDHRHSLRLDPHDIVRLADARIVDICAD